MGAGARSPAAAIAAMCVRLPSCGSPIQAYERPLFGSRLLAVGARIDPEGRVQFDDIDASHEWASVDELAADFWRWQRLDTKEQQLDSMAAYFCIDDLMASPDPGALDVVEALLASAETDQECCYVGAGPLEDLLSHHGHGRRFVGEVEQRAHRTSRLRRALVCVYLGDDVPADVRDRLAPPSKWMTP